MNMILKKGFKYVMKIKKYTRMPINYREVEYKGTVSRKNNCHIDRKFV